MLLNRTNFRQNANINNQFLNSISQRTRNVPRNISELFPSRTNTSNTENVNNTQNDTTANAASDQTNDNVYGVGAKNSRIGQIVKQSVNLNAFQSMIRINMNKTILQEQMQTVNRAVQERGTGNPISRASFNPETLENIRPAQPQLDLSTNIPRITEEERNQSLFEPNINRLRRYGAIRNQDFTNLNFRINNARERIRSVRNTISSTPQTERRTVSNIASRIVNQPQETTANRTNENRANNRLNNNTVDFENLLNPQNQGRRIDLFT